MNIKYFSFSTVKIEEKLFSAMIYIKQLIIIDIIIIIFNFISSIVVFQQLRKKSRVHIIEYFVDVAKECVNIGNFNSLMAIIGEYDLYGADFCSMYRYLIGIFVQKCSKEIFLSFIYKFKFTPRNNLLGPSIRWQMMGLQWILGLLILICIVKVLIISSSPPSSSSSFLHCVGPFVSSLFNPVLFFFLKGLVTIDAVVLHHPTK